MPSEKKIAEKAAKDLVKKINTLSRTNLSYRSIYSQVKKILAIKDEGQRAQALSQYQYAVASKIMEKVLPAKNVEWSNDVIFQREMDKGNSIKGYSITKISSNGINIVRSVCDCIVPNYSKTHEISLDELKIKYEWEKEQLKKYTVATEMPKILKSWDKTCFETEIQRLEKAFEGRKVTDQMNTLTDKTAAEMYYRSTLLKNELSRHGRIWRWFNSKKVSMYQEHIAATDRILEKCGFDEAKHGEKAMQIVQSNLFISCDVDKENVETSYDNEREAYRARHVEQLTIARDKVKAANEKDKVHETSFFKKIEPYAKKYGMEAKKVGAFQSSIDPASSARDYDERRDTSNTYRDAQRAFIRSFEYILSDALKNGKETNIPQMLSDAREIAVIAMQHYSLCYEIKDFNEKNIPMYMEGLTGDIMKNRINLTTKGQNIPEEKLEQMRKEAAETLEGWQNNIDKVMKEDVQLAERYFEKTVEKNADPKLEVKEEISEQKLSSADSIVKEGVDKEPILVDLEEEKNVEKSQMIKNNGFVSQKDPMNKV